MCVCACEWQVTKLARPPPAHVFVFYCILHVYMYVYTCIDSYVYIYIHTYIFIHIYMCTYTCQCIHTDTLKSQVYCQKYAIH